MTSDYFVSEDLAQETFLSAYKNLGSFDGKYEKAWICTIATNKCRDYLQSAGRRSIPVEETELGEQVDQQKTPEQACLEEEVRKTLLERCQSLKSPYDEIARLYYYEELDVDEIAQKKDMKRKTVQTQIYRARAMLRKVYGKEKAYDT